MSAVSLAGDGGIRRVAEAMVAAALLLLLSPLLMLGAALVGASLGRPLLFRQERAGRHGRPFRLVKLRTMRDARGPGGRMLPDGERLTRTGRLLRTTSLDELPGLWNVVRGDMALVGPRPLPVRYGPCFSPRERLRLAVRPGVTGWAQVRGRNALSWRERLELDAWYVEHRSLRLDLEILARTVIVVLLRRGADADPRASLPDLDAEPRASVRPFPGAPGARGAGVPPRVPEMHADPRVRIRFPPRTRPMPSTESHPVPPHVGKLATSQAGRRRMLHFSSARAAFRAYLAAAVPAGDRAVLLPAYIGWSAREGSGVFDPVRELKLPYRFYAVGRDLRVDAEAVERELAAGGVGVLVLIHYFGYPDPAFPTLAESARRHGVLVVEDEAHALLTDLVGGAAGRLGDACIFSLHKMLPVPEGGMLAIGAEAAGPGADDVRDAHPEGPQAWEYDLHFAAERRRANAVLLHRGLADLAGDVDPLWDAPPPGVVPQTFPVVVRTVSRDALYFGMNEAGFGVVSLYHTLVGEIPDAGFDDARWLARHVMNLPVHQDADEHALRRMLDELRRQVGTLKGGRDGA